MIQISIVDTLLGFMNEYVKVNICDIDTYKTVARYDMCSMVDEEYLGCKVVDFVIDTKEVTIWIEVK